MFVGTPLKLNNYDSSSIALHWAGVFGSVSILSHYFRVIKITIWTCPQKPELAMRLLFQSPPALIQAPKKWTGVPTPPRALSLFRASALTPALIFRNLAALRCSALPPPTSASQHCLLLQRRSWNYASKQLNSGWFSLFLFSKPWLRLWPWEIWRLRLRLASSLKN